MLCATAADLKAVVESLYPAAVGYDTDAAALDTDETNDGYGQYRARLCDSVASDPLNSVNDRYAVDNMAVVDANRDLHLLLPEWSVFSDQGCNLGIGLDVAPHTGSTFSDYVGRYNQPDPAVAGAVTDPWVYQDTPGLTTWGLDAAYFNPLCNGFELGAAADPEYFSYNPCELRTTEYSSCVGMCNGAEPHYAGVTGVAPADHSLYNITAWTTPSSLPHITKVDILVESHHTVQDTFCPHNNFDAESHTASCEKACEPGTTSRLPREPSAG